MRKGSKHSLETRRKISKANKGKNKGENNPMWGKRGEKSPNWGRKQSPETRRKISEALKGRLFSLEHRQRIGEGKRGKKRAPFSLEHRRRIGESQRARWEIRR